jgi:hypothetical protein
VALDIPSMRTTIPITAIHRRNGYVSAAAKSLLILLTEGGAVSQPRRAQAPPSAAPAGRST